MKIALTGGGTAGHAMVNKVLLPFLMEDQETKLLYIGSKKGAERELIEKEEGIFYAPISTGKLRRYLSFENVMDFFRVLKGIGEAYRILKREKADVVFSGGGFVSLPVVIAAWLQKLPILIRETDISMGLANRICMRFAKKIITTFPDTLKSIHGIACECGGLVIRPELLKGSRKKTEEQEAGKGRINVLIIGGSLGSQRINQTIWENAEHLSQLFRITHLCGRGKTNPAITVPGYVQYEYAKDMTDFYAQADVIVMRCGSNAVSEILALGKRAVCIPISTKSSRGEQHANAGYAVHHGCAVLLEEEQLDETALINAITAVLLKPLNKSCLLTEEILNENCRYLLREIQAAAMTQITPYPVSGLNITQNQ